MKRGSFSSFISLLRTPAKPTNGDLANMEMIAETEEMIDDENVCMLEDNPVRALKLASSGQAEELDYTLTKSPSVKYRAIDTTGQGLWHYAAKEGHLNAMDVLLSHGLDINIQDNKGNTPLHVSVMTCKLSSINYLIVNGANTSILNKHSAAPLHVACELNLLEVLKELLSHKEVDVHLKGLQQSTAIHYCCSVNADECLRLMISHGCKMCEPDGCGLHPAHTAVKNGADRCLSVIVEIAERGGYCMRRDIMNRRDKDGNVLLHTAVNTGDIKSVKMCLECEADIDVTTMDESTPVHYACSKGEEDIVKTMLEWYPKKVDSVLVMKDNNGHTPLHKAALYNHPPVIEYLLKRGADIEAPDFQEYTPLLLAASKGSMNACATLIHCNASIRAKDVNERNLAHLLILGGAANLPKFQLPISAKAMLELVNDRDIFGCTPLHYATKMGFLKTTFHFLNLGATCTIPNNERSTSLHFAARYGRFNTCVRLLETPDGMRALNCTDHGGMIPLHAAALNGHTKVVQLLLERGCIFHRCYGGNTPLHFATMHGHLSTIKYLLDVNPSLLDVQTAEGMTALHIASKNNHPEVVDFLLTAGAKFIEDNLGCTFFTYALTEKNMDVCRVTVQHNRLSELLASSDKVGGCPFMGLMRELPSLCLLAMDRSIRPIGKVNDKNFGMEFNFSILQKKDSCVQNDPLYVVKKMVEWQRVELLRHPLCENYLRFKWRDYGRYLHYGNLLLYFLFLASLTYMAIQTPPLRHMETATPDCFKLIWTDPQNACSLVAILFIACFSGINLLKEMYQMYLQRLNYFLELVNYIEWVVYVTSGLFAFPYLFGQAFHWQMNAEALAVFCAWFNFLLFMQRFGSTGIYVVMCLQILGTLVTALCVYSILIISFALSFYILLKLPDAETFKLMSPTDQDMYKRCYIGYNQTTWNNTVENMDASLQAWQTPGLAILKTVMMMMGEYDYVNTFTSKVYDGDNLTMHFDGMTYFMLCIFILLMPILLINLLIGLAVGDIESVRRNAELKHIAMQVQWLGDIEPKFPRSIRKRLYKEVVTVYINTCLGKGIIPSVMKAFKNREALLFGGHADSRTCLQDKKIQAMQKELQRQTELLRLIVQKMEIEAEADEKDEGTEEFQFELATATKSKSTATWEKMKAGAKAIHKIKALPSVDSC